MSPITIVAKNKEVRSSVESVSTSGGIKKLLESTGRMPPVSLILKPLDGSPEIVLDRFLTYRFSSSMLIPVDTFDFNFVAPDDKTPFHDRIKDGDIVTLFANGRQIATGLIDQTEVEVDTQFGEKVSISGRDLLSQLEDNDTVSVNNDQFWGEFTIRDGIRKLIQNTRIRDSKIVLQDAPSKPYLLATEPGETRLAALQRFLEPLNCIAWMLPDGSIKVGRPNMAQGPKGTLICSKDRRESNVISMRVTRSSTNIPNVVLPIWSGQEQVQSRVPKEQQLLNQAKGPSRLRQNGHIVAKAVVVSTPQGASPQELSGVNALKAGSSNLLQSYAKREIARHNHREMIVQVVVPGHYDENGEPWSVDTVYKIEFDRGKVDENMFLFQVDYELTEEKGQMTNLYFCRLGTIVSDVRAK